jgi:hypothetical protein
MFAYDYPLLGLFWTMLIFFIWISWLMILFNVVIDIFRSDDLGGGGKAGWMLLVIVLPILGVLIYVLSRGDSMRQREVARAQAHQGDFDSYIRSAVSSSSGVADELSKLGELQASGVITADEFDRQKTKLLA